MGVGEIFMLKNVKKASTQQLSRLYNTTFVMLIK